MMNEVIFLVEEASEGGWIARALGHSIFTEADDLSTLHENVRDAVRCHFEEGQEPRIIRLDFVRTDVAEHADMSHENIALWLSG
ncbi:MAG: 2-oxoisovalerate dehydrogenase [Thermomicrobiales bacterium]